MKINEMDIKGEIKFRNLSQSQVGAIRYLDGEVELETEKAYLIVFTTIYGKVSLWCPKSCILTEEQKMEIKERQEKRINKYEEFVERAKSLGVKGIRNKMKVMSILNKAREQGITLSY